MQNEMIRTRKKRYKFNIMREAGQLESLDATLPKLEVRKYISQGGFSSIAFIKFVAARTTINDLTVSTLRVGRKHLQCLDVMHQQGKLGHVVFVVGSLVKNDSAIGKLYKYYDDLSAVCKKNDWQIVVYNNYSKVLLMDTARGKFVVETSSNLNENPNMEQFSFEKSDELYNFYMKAFNEIIFSGGDGNAGVKK